MQLQSCVDIFETPMSDTIQNNYRELYPIDQELVVGAQWLWKPNLIFNLFKMVDLIMGLITFFAFAIWKRVIYLLMSAKMDTFSSNRTRYEYKKWS